MRTHFDEQKFFILYLAPLILLIFDFDDYTLSLKK